MEKDYKRITNCLKGLKRELVIDFLAQAKSRIDVSLSSGKKKVSFYIKANAYNVDSGKNLCFESKVLSEEYLGRNCLLSFDFKGVKIAFNAVLVKKDKLFLLKIPEVLKTLESSNGERLARAVLGEKQYDVIYFDDKRIMLDTDEVKAGEKCFLTLIFSVKSDKEVRRKMSINCVAEKSGLFRISKIEEEDKRFLQESVADRTTHNYSKGF